MGARRRGGLAVLLILGLLGLLAPGGSTSAAALTQPVATPTATQAALDQAQPAPQPPEDLPEPQLTAAGAILWDPADSIALYEREADVPRRMASLTKIMTVLLAIEAGAVDDVVTVSAAAASLGGASLGLQPGQQIPMRSLIAGLLLRSGNDAALALAEHLDRSEAAFVGRMNRRAAELGLADTHFVNASGLTDDPAHHSSPSDLARLAVEAMRHPDFALYAGSPRAEVPGLPPMANRNELVGVYPGMTGVKTGYTALAGLCLVGSATRDGRTLYAVVLNSEDSFADVAALLDYGFAGFRRTEPAAAGARVGEYRWADTAVDVVAAAPLAATVGAEQGVTWRVHLEPSLQRPLEAGATAGRAELLVDGRVWRTVLLELAEPAPAPLEPDGGARRAGAAVQDALRVLGRLHAVDRAA